MSQLNPERTSWNAIEFRMIGRIMDSLQDTLKVYFERMEAQEALIQSQVSTISHLHLVVEHHRELLRTALLMLRYLEEDAQAESHQ